MLRAFRPEMTWPYVSLMQADVTTRTNVVVEKIDSVRTSTSSSIYRGIEIFHLQSIMAVSMVSDVFRHSISTHAIPNPCF